jgi:hypothetical protein
MPRHSWGPATRTHRVRPSEKTAFPVISGLSPLGHLAVGWSTPRRGGLSTPVKTAWAQPRRVPAKGPAVAYFSVIMPYPGLHPARIRGRNRVRPSEKITLPVISEPYPTGQPALGLAPRGGAGSARPQGGHGLDRGMCPVGHRASRLRHRVEMKCLGHS